MHVTTAAKLMGHADPDVKLRIYTQDLDDEIYETGEVLSRLFSI